MKAPSLIKKHIRRKNNRGIAVIYIALLLVVLLAFAGLAIDIGYMYVAKTQLQNAADAAALAGASKLLSEGAIGTLSDPAIPLARAEATSFALKNKAAGSNIVIMDDGTNVIDKNNDNDPTNDVNDIAVGYWNGTTFTPGSTPVNAIQVRPRRTVGSPGGRIGIFFAKVIGFDTLPAAAVATAALPLRASVFMAFCIKSCSGCASVPCTYPSGRQYETGPGEPYDFKFAWTTLLENPTSANALENLMCTNTPFVDVCNKYIYATMGGPTSSLRDMESAFYDTNLDAANKDFAVVDGQQIVTGWEVIVPITELCPPGSEGSAYDPKKVIQFAKVHITAICATGAASGCWGASPNLNTACNDETLPSKNCCKNFSNNVIVVDKVQCVSCNDPSIFSGTKVALVK